MSLYNMYAMFPGELHAIMNHSSTHSSLPTLLKHSCLGFDHRMGVTKKAWNLAFQQSFFYFGTCRQTFFHSHSTRNSTVHIRRLKCLLLYIFQNGIRESSIEGSWREMVIYDFCCMLFSVPPCFNNSDCLTVPQQQQQNVVTGVYLSSEDTC